MHWEKRPFWLIDKRILHRMVWHARLDYPNEACGILLCPSKRPMEIVAAFKAKNESRERLRDRYSLDPRDFLKIFERGERAGLDICGFYHSHPDHPALPSSYDREMAWNGYVYLILEIRKGKFFAARAWAVKQEEEPFREEALCIRQRRADRFFFRENR